MKLIPWLTCLCKPHSTSVQKCVNAVRNKEMWNIIPGLFYQMGVINFWMFWMFCWKTPSQEGFLLQYHYIASHILTPLHNMKLHYFIEEKAPQIMMESPSLCCVKKKTHLHWELLVIPGMLEALRFVFSALFTIVFLLFLCYLMVIGLQSASVRGMIWVGDLTVKS